MNLITSLLILFIASTSAAAFELPGNLSDPDRLDILEILGPPSAHRSLSAAYPLGGNDGFEVGLARNYINIADLSAIDASVQNEDNISYPIMTIGKGLFYDIDLFMSFVPFAQSDTIQNASALVRWSFLELESWPVYLSVSANAGNSSYLNKLTIQNYGYDFYANFKTQNLSLYVAIGSLFSHGQFVGGSDGLNASGVTESNKITVSHSVVGADLQLKSWFLAGQLDRYYDANYSVKIGYRF